MLPSAHSDILDLLLDAKSPRSALRLDVAWGAVLGLLAALVIAPGFVAAGSEFDEGILVTFPTRVLAGQLPYRDFESFYGPANAYLVAGVFKVFGSSLGAERAVGFAFRVVIVLALYWVLLPFGRRAAFAGGVITTLIMVATGILLDSYAAAVALAVLAIGVAYRKRGNANPAWLGVVGFLVGLAGLFRAELVVFTLVALIPLVFPTRARALIAGAIGLLVGLFPYLPLAIATGLHRLERNYHDLGATGRDRRLPIVIGVHGDAGHLLLAHLGALALLAGATVIAFRSHAPSGRLLASLWVLSAFNITFGLWRFDEPHVATAATVVLATIPAAASVVAAGVMPKHQSLCVALAFCFVLVYFAGIGLIRDGLKRNTNLALGNTHSYVVSYHARSFRIANKVAAHNIQRAVETADRLAPPGGSLFVGPSDLRRTNGNDVFVYYLLPRLRPASFYIEMDPPVSRATSGLAADIRRASVLILARRWNIAKEPNASRRFGSDRPNQVVRSDFCRRATFGGYTVLTHCR